MRRSQSPVSKEFDGVELIGRLVVGCSLLTHRRGRGFVERQHVRASPRASHPLSMAPRGFEKASILVAARLCCSSLQQRCKA